MMIGRLGLRRDPAPAAAGGRRMLVTVTVGGSAGPIRFVVGEEKPVAAVIGTFLRCYARKGRFPALGCNVDEFPLLDVLCREAGRLLRPGHGRQGDELIYGHLRRWPSSAGRPVQYGWREAPSPQRSIFLVLRQRVSPVRRHSPLEPPQPRHLNDASPS